MGRLRLVAALLDFCTSRLRTGRAGPRNLHERQDGYRQATQVSHHRLSLNPRTYVARRRVAANLAACDVQIKTGGNAMQGNGSVRSLLTCCDGAAESLRDVMLLIGRISVAAMFYLTVSKGSPTAAYLTFLGYPAPGFFSALAQVAEWVIVVSLVLGLGTRLGAVIAALFIVIASVTAHQYWHYPQAAQLVQATYLAKNFAALGGALLVFVVGAGRYSVDARMLGKA